MKSVLFLWLFFASFCIGSAAQETCNLETKDLPAFYNLKLEMTGVEARAAFGKDLKIKIKKKGLRVFFQNFIEKPAPQSLNNVRALYLRFFNGQLFQIEIFYENKPEWKTLEAFKNYLETTLNLPDAWRDLSGRQTIICFDFSVFADKVLNPRVEITDETTRARADEFLQRQKKK